MFYLGINSFSALYVSMIMSSISKSKSKYIKRVHSVKIQRHTDSRADVIDTPSKTTLNIPKKIKYAQPVPSRRFQYKSIGKMQFEMRKMLFIRKRRFLNLI